MRRAYLICVALVAGASLFPRAADARRGECRSGEELVSAMPVVKPVWVDQPHIRVGMFEMFVGLSTQNDKLEDGIERAVESANGSIVEALGQVIQKRGQGVITFESDDIRQSFGSAGAASFLKNKERRGIYYEKWVSYERCQPRYRYNVWALMAVPRAEFDGEAARAERYLRDLQRAEEERAKPSLMPSPDAMQVRKLPEKPTPPRDAARAGADAAAASAAMPEPADAMDAYEFRCGSIGLSGGYTYIPPVDSPMGRHERGLFNVNMDAEWGITHNICMGMGFGWAVTERSDGGRGNIVPMYFRFAARGPFDGDGRFVGWLGAEIGAAVLQGFDRRDGADGPRKTTAGFMAGPGAGIDFRLQGKLYLTVAGVYTPIIYRDIIHMVQGWIGIRYYFRNRADQPQRKG